MKLMPRLFATLALAACLALPARAEMLPAAEVLKQVDVLMGNRETAKWAIGANLPPMPDGHMGVLIDRIVFMFKDQKFRDAFVARFPGGLDSNNAMQASFEFALELLSKGLVLLPEADQLEFVKFTREYMAYLTADECKAIIADPKLNAKLAMDTEMRFSATLPAERFIRIQTYYREASMAALYGKPAAVALTAEDTAAANAKMADLTNQVAASIPPEDPQKFTDLKTVPGETLCKFTIDLFDKILGLDPAARRPVVSIFLASMSQTQ